MRKNQSRRTFIVFVSLVAVLTFTSVLLLALAPAPLRPDRATMMAAVDDDPLKVIFETSVKPATGQWKYIYIHHSNTMTSVPAGGDHFIITNGQDSVDGQIQLTDRWNNQQSPLPPAGATEIDPGCISICLVGNFNISVPTQKQLGQLVQLVNSLKNRLEIKGDHVLLVTDPKAGVAGIGRYFPADALKAQVK